MNEEQSSKRNKRIQFGQLVRSLRLEQVYFDAKSSTSKSWTQEHLAIKLGVSEQRISDLERGKIKDIEPYVQPLANIFRLTGIKREHFYRTAGLSYPQDEPPPPPPPNLQELQQLGENSPYPTTVRNALWDFCFMNSLHRSLWGMNSGLIDALQNGPMGPNLLWFLFNEKLRKQSYSIPYHYWREETIYSFKQTAFYYNHTKAYQNLMQCMNKIPHFREAWHTVANAEQTGNYSFRRICRVYLVNHPEFGVMKFNSVREQDMSGNNFIIAHYIPTQDSEEQYRKFRASVKERLATVFPYKAFV